MVKKPAKTLRAKKREHCLPSSAAAATPKADKAAGAAPVPSDEAVLEILRESCRRGYPNPERKGCPSKDVLAILALYPGQIPVTDPVTDHVTHCSPCFNEIENFRAASKKIG
ncbi:MAG: hypothetical protein ABSG25_08485 [Bryobacteraceae bacterium]